MPIEEPRGKIRFHRAITCSIRRITSSFGSAYLNVLSYALLEQIDNEVSREYCVISAYNTGTRNVFKTFAGDSVAALNHINGLEPPAVYDRLRNNLPYQETRDYLVKVVTFRKQFASTREGNDR